MKINTNKCYNCGACASVCPLNIIQVTDRTIKIGKDCTNCGQCEKTCPVKAIKND